MACHHRHHGCGYRDCHEDCPRGAIAFSRDIISQTSCLHAPCQGSTSTCLSTRGRYLLRSQSHPAFPCSSCYRKSSSTFPSKSLPPRALVDLLSSRPLELSAQCSFR